jgi:gliding motility-associated-like protein
VAAFTVEPVCKNETSVFTNNSSISNGTITQWNWNLGDGTNSSQQNPSYTYANDGNYNVTLQVTSDNGCTASSSGTAIVHPLPVVNFSVNNVCLGGAADFNDLTTIGSGNTLQQWNWDFGDGTGTANIPNPSYTYNDIGNYTVTLTVTSNNNCTAASSKTIAVFDNPVVSFETSPACYDENNGSATAIASGGSGDYSYLWDNGQQSAVINNLYAGNYNITITDGNGCTNTGSATVSEYNAPVIPVIVPDSQRIVFGDTVNVQIYSNFDPNVVYTISPNYNISCNNCNSLLAYPNQTTVYTVRAIDTLSGCKGSAEFVIRVDEKYILFVPNIFTPNGDGVNDDIRVYAKAVKFFYFRIFNRWGELVFYTEDINRPWDGTYKGKVVDPGVYVYQVKLGYLNGVTKDAQGSITVAK